MLLAPQLLWCQRPQSQWVCIASGCLPLHLYFPQRLPAPRSLLGSWWSNSSCILQQASGWGPQQPWSRGRFQGPYRPSALSSLSVFHCPLQFFALRLHISWDSVGCSLCSPEDRLGVPAGHKEKLPPTSLPSCFTLIFYSLISSAVFQEMLGARSLKQTNKQTNKRPGVGETQKTFLKGYMFFTPGEGPLGCFNLRQKNWSSDWIWWD